MERERSNGRGWGAGGEKKEEEGKKRVTLKKDIQEGPEKRGGMNFGKQNKKDSWWERKPKKRKRKLTAAPINAS